MNTRVQKIARLKNKKYREAFVGSQINVGLPFQIRALREQREWKQSQLAEKAGMLQPRISAMERPGGAKFNLETLRRLASAFDVAMVVRFVPFSELVEWSERFSPDDFRIPSFEEDSLLEADFQQPESALVAAAGAVDSNTTPALIPFQDTVELEGICTEQKPPQKTMASDRMMAA